MLTPFRSSFVGAQRHWIVGTRYASSNRLEAGEEKSGHISAGPNEGLLFFDSKLPCSCPARDR